MTWEVPTCKEVSGEFLKSINLDSESDLIKIDEEKLILAIKKALMGINIPIEYLGDERKYNGRD